MTKLLLASLPMCGRVGGTVLAAALLLPSAALAEMQPPNALARESPVHVTSCRVSSTLLSHDVDHPSELVAGPLSFSLKNFAPQVATEVTLRIRYGGLTENLLERGVFSTGARVVRSSEVIAYSPWVGSRPDACTVVSVKFADGTAWVPAKSSSVGSR